MLTIRLKSGLFSDFYQNQNTMSYSEYNDTGEWTTEYFRFWRCKETLLEFGYREIDL